MTYTLQIYLHQALMFDRSPHRIWLGFSKMAGPKALPALVWFALCCTTLQETLVAPPLYFTNFLYFAHFVFCNYRLCECIDGTGAASLRAVCVSTTRWLVLPFPLTPTLHSGQALCLLLLAAGFAKDFTGQSDSGGQCHGTWL